MNSKTIGSSAVPTEGVASGEGAASVAIGEGGSHEASWIACEPRRPDLGQWVLGFWVGAAPGTEVREMQWTCGKYKTPSWHWRGKRVGAVISHWMPMPRPPQ